MSPPAFSFLHAKQHEQQPTHPASHDNDTPKKRDGVVDKVGNKGQKNKIRREKKRSKKKTNPQKALTNKVEES